MRFSTVSRTAVMVASLSVLPASIAASAADAQSYPAGGLSGYPPSGSYGNQGQEQGYPQQQGGYPQQQGGYPRQQGYPQQQPGYRQQGYDQNDASPPGFDDYDRAAPRDYDPSRPPPRLPATGPIPPTPLIPIRIAATKPMPRTGHSVIARARAATPARVP